MEGTCVVVDLGTGSVKAEMAGAEAPQIFPNVVGNIKYNPMVPDSTLPGLIDGSMLVSSDVEKHRGLLKITHPMEHGHITDWKGLTHVLKHVNNRLGVPAKDHPLLVTEAPNTSRLQRNKLAQILFEELQYPALLFSVQAVLSLYSTGNTTGVVLDIGDGVTHCCPVYEGYTIREACTRVDFGGRDVTNYLQLLLRQHGTFLDTSAEFEMVREIKEQHCVVEKIKRDESARSGASSVAVKAKLPDGTEIQLGRELTQAPEVLFNPSLIGSECPGVVGLLSDSIRRCDLDMRRQLYESIFLSGGTTLMQGFPARLIGDFAKLAPKDCKCRINAPAERLHTTWIGGSFLAQLTSFKSMVTKRADYQEQGERILHSRLFF
jgi:centractin